MKESETVQARMDAYAKTLIEKLKTSEGTWMKPWEDFQGRHQNLWTEAVYRGGNILRTMLHCMTFDKGSHYWVGPKEVKKRGLRIRKGAVGCPIAVPMPFIKEDDEELVFYRYRFVFNSEDIEGLEVPPLELHPLQLDEQCQVMEDDIKGIGADLQFSAGVAIPSYSPSKDMIRIPLKDQFHGQEEYVSTLAHEHVHWTGAKTRLAREGITTRDRDKQVYAFEELIAEIGASFMALEYGLKAEKLQHIEYIKAWIRLLEDKPRAIFTAAEQAQKAVSYLKTKI